MLALAFIQWCEVRRNSAISEEAPAGGGLISWHDAAPAAHRRLAVVLGLWIAFQSVTGLVLLFRDPIEHWAHPGLTRHGHGDRGAAAALEAVRRRYPDKVVGPLATPAVSDGVYVIEVGDREVYVDPARARINGSRDHEAGFTALVERLHRRFLFDSVAGLSGARLVALLGLGWLVVSLTGLTTARRTPRTLHRTIGFVVVVPMVLVVVTGVRLAVPDGSDRIWAALTGGGHGRSDAPPQGVTVTSGDRGGDPLDATRILAALDRKYPDGLVARLLMPPP
ncbi:MAG TPA: PepSY-associated TM helix domain-containing protein, partial [Acidimicrobiia bacterium]|nr:PepSY-associated TM helix domain-containing protein [Acidimicrobiia bacterium]